MRLFKNYLVAAGLGVFSVSAVSLPLVVPQVVRGLDELVEIYAGWDHSAKARKQA